MQRSRRTGRHYFGALSAGTCHHFSPLSGATGTSATAAILSSSSSQTSAASSSFTQRGIQGRMLPWRETVAVVVDVGVVGDVGAVVDKGGRGPGG